MGAFLHKEYGDDILPSWPVDAQEIIANTTWDESGQLLFQVDVELDAILTTDDVINITVLQEK